MSPNGKYLYVSMYNDTIYAYDINATGALTYVATTTLSPSSGAEVFGIAVSPSGSYLVASRGVGTTSYMDEFSIGSGGTLTQVGSDVTMTATAQRGIPASSTSNGDLVAFTGTNEGDTTTGVTNTLTVVTAGSSWSSANMQTHTHAYSGGVYSNPAFDPTNTYIYTVSQGTSCSGNKYDALGVYLVGSGGASVSPTGEVVCSTLNITGSAATDTTDSLLIGSGVASIATATTPVYVSAAGEGSFDGVVFVH